jgi:hypothetical protein
VEDAFFELVREIRKESFKGSAEVGEKKKKKKFLPDFKKLCKLN